MKNPESFPSREAQKQKETGDVSIDVLAQIRSSEQQEELERQRKEREKPDSLKREREEYQKGIDALREQHKAIIEVISDPNWIDVKKLEKYAPQIPPDVFALVKQINGRNLGPGRDEPYQRIEVKFLRQELRGRVEELLKLNPQTLRDMGIKLDYESGGGIDPGHWSATKEQYSFGVKDNI